MLSTYHSVSNTTVLMGQFVITHDNVGGNYPSRGSTIVCKPLGRSMDKKVPVQFGADTEYQVDDSISLSIVALMYELQGI